jgi:hypothetical protein
MISKPLPETLPAGTSAVGGQVISIGTSRLDETREWYRGGWPVGISAIGVDQIDWSTAPTPPGPAAEHPTHRAEPATEKRAELRQLAQEAASRIDTDNGFNWYGIEHVLKALLAARGDSLTTGPELQDAAFIAAAHPGAVLALLDALDAKDEELAGARATPESPACNCRSAPMGSTFCDSCRHDLGCPVHNAAPCRRTR